MRCSSSERLLARFVDGALSTRARVDVATHLGTCTHCTAMLDELKNIDALLLTATTPELPVDFTRAVMAHTKSMPAPHARRISLWIAAALYVVAAWIAVAAWLLGARSAAIADVTNIPSPIAGVLGAVSAAAGAAEHALGPGTALITGFVVLVLALDALALAALIYFYRIVRPRLVAAIAQETHR